MAEPTGERLCARLKAVGMSKRQLAAESEVSYRTVCKIAAGDRLGNLDTWMKFANVLECSVSELTGEVEAAWHDVD